MKEKDTTKKQQKQQNQVTKFRDKNLSYKISVAVSLLLVICLTVMIAISATIAGVANTGNRPLPTAAAEFSSVTITSCLPLIPASNILSASLSFLRQNLRCIKFL